MESLDTASAARRPLITRGNILRAVLGVSLAGFLIWNVIKRTGVDLRQQIQSADPVWLVAAFLVYGVALSITFLRWQLLLRVQQVDIHFRDVARLGMIGTFLSFFLPGAVTGDLFKMVFIARHAGKRTTEAVLTIMLDRVIGLLGLLVVAAVSVLFSRKFLAAAPPVIHHAAWLVGLGSVAGMLGMLAVMFHRPLLRLPGVRQVLAQAARLLPETIVDIVSRLSAAMDSYRQHRKTLVLALGLSVCVHSILALSSWGLAQGFHEHRLKLREYFVAMQVANCAGAIPLTPAGVGIRDQCLSHFYEAAGAEPATAGMVCAVYSLIIAIWSLLGGLFFFLPETRGAPQPPSRDEKETESLCTGKD